MIGDRITNQCSCRFCGSTLRHVFVDLGMSPLCESYLTFEQLNEMEPFYPLRVFICEKCFLVQLEEFVSPENIFSEYAYFSSYSDSWVQHAKKYAEMVVQRFKLNRRSRVIEIASNDGYLLQFFVAKKIPALGIEPAKNVAAAAIEKKVPTVVEFFDEGTALELAGQSQHADLLIGNNVLAQVPNLESFVKGMKIVLKPRGVITMEFPYLMWLIEENQFDTIYHEHFSYFSLITVEKIFAEHGLTVFDVDELPTHGGSLRIYARHTDDKSKEIGKRVRELEAKEEVAGYRDIETYFAFSERVKETKRKLLKFVIECKRQKKSIVGYGAPGKGNTLLNYCGIRGDFLDYTVDRNPYKQGKYLPGTHIPIFHPDVIKNSKPDYLLVLPWNVKDEIMEQTSYIRKWGGQFVVPIPEVTIYS
jgi:2-polyprenyl-3-methyl-5-hydroxy-6-metoxy-1,4-benzoquinol methylase